MPLKNLEGVSATELEHLFFKSPNEIRLSNLKKRIAYTSAESNGAVNIYLDDDGFLRCERFFYQKCVDKKVFTNMKDVRDWAGSSLIAIK